MMCALSSNVSGKPACALVDAALALNECIERFGMGLVPQCIPQSAGPFGPSALIDLGWIGSAANDCGKWLLAVEWADPPQPQCPVSAVQSLVFSCPPGDQIKHGGQIGVNGVPIPAGPALLPRLSNRIQVRPLFATNSDPSDGAKTGVAEPPIAKQSRSWRAASGMREVMRGS